MSSTHQIDGHTLTLLRNGEEYFPRLIAAIDSATQSIYLETYIFATDGTGRAVSDALQRAAQRKVAVHLLLDGFGAADLPQTWVDELRAAKVEVLWFRKEVGRFSLRRYHLRRLHRKLTVIDQRMAFVSGININDDIPGGAVTAPRLDYTVLVEGEVVAQIYTAMRRLWTLVSWANLRRHREHAPSLSAPQHSKPRNVIFLVRDNLGHRRDIEQAYLQAIADAQHDIIIANAYFLPGRRLRHALLHARRRGVRVVLLLQGQVEYRLQHYATLALYGQLLEAGMEIYEYHASFMHAKVAVIDGYWSTVGSSNIDPFSLWLAREANLVVRDAQFATALHSSLMQEIEHNCRPVSHSVWREHGWVTRLLMRISYASVRFLTGVIGYARGYDDI
ncbi:MAG: cardiolipin synthase ClsB [Gallionellaceae bacterium]|nr:cardiolipin synthase ClsB [Gallionellaceae bacterium]